MRGIGWGVSESGKCGRMTKGGECGVECGEWWWIRGVWGRMESVGSVEKCRQFTSS